MRRQPVVFRREAQDDLYDIFLLVTRMSGSTRTAREFVGRLKARCRRIGDAPRGGAPRTDLAAGLRTIPFERAAVIAYRVEADRVRIINVFYGGRDYESLYQRGSIEP